MPFDPNQPIWVSLAPSPLVTVLTPPGTYPVDSRITQDPTTNTYRFTVKVTINQRPNRSDGTPLRTLPLPHSANLSLIDTASAQTPLIQVTVTSADMINGNATHPVAIELTNPAGHYTLHATDGTYAQDYLLELS